MAITHRELSITAAIFFVGSALLSLGILGVNVWAMHDLTARDILRSIYELRAILGYFLGMFAASSILAVFAIRFWQLAPPSRWFMVASSVAAALTVCVAINWFFALFLAVGASLLALAQRARSRNHA
jgi:hypothetical protein